MWLEWVFFLYIVHYQTGSRTYNCEKRLIFASFRGSSFHIAGLVLLFVPISKGAPSRQMRTSWTSHWMTRLQIKQPPRSKQAFVVIWPERKWRMKSPEKRWAGVMAHVEHLPKLNTVELWCTRLVGRIVGMNTLTSDVGPEKLNKLNIACCIACILYDMHHNVFLQYRNT